jgi:hypothetical protein
MQAIFESWPLGASIPVQQHVKNRKLVKYFNRETAAAIVACDKLLQGINLDPQTPFYYETGIMEFEELGLDAIADASLDEEGRFSQRLFVEKGAKAVPPLTQFKALYNMPLSFVAIEHGLTGDNAVLYASAQNLLLQALHAPGEQPVLLGSGNVHANGAVDSGFALLDRVELAALPWPSAPGEAIALFAEWAARGGA